MDWQGIDWIAKKSWEIHKSHANHTKLSKNSRPFAIQPKPWQCRHNLLQSCGSRLGGRFSAIHLQYFNLSKNGPLISQPIPDRLTIEPIIASISTIKLDCKWIAKLQRITRRLIGSWEIHNPAQSVWADCEGIPGSASVTTQSRRVASGTQETPQSLTINSDCYAISKQQRIAPESRAVHNRSPDRSDFHAIIHQIAAQSTRKWPRSTQSTRIAIGLQNYKGLQRDQ